MALVTPNASEAELLDRMLNHPLTPDKIQLFTNSDPSFPSSTSVFTDFVFVTGTGAPTAKNLTAASGLPWTITNGLALFNNGTQIDFNFTSGAGWNVYGYAVFTSDISPILLWAERFTSAPYVIPTGGGTISIIARVTLS